MQPAKDFYNIVPPMSNINHSNPCDFYLSTKLNEFFVPLIFLSNSRLFTIPLALSLFTTESGVQWHLLWQRHL